MIIWPDTIAITSTFEMFLGENLFQQHRQIISNTWHSEGLPISRYKSYSGKRSKLPALLCNNILVINDHTVFALLSKNYLPPKVLRRRGRRRRRGGKINYANAAWREIIISGIFSLWSSSGTRSDYLFYIFFFDLYYRRAYARKGEGRAVFKELFKLKFTVAQLRCLRCAICYIMTCCISSYSMRSWIDKRRECAALKLSWQLISWVAGKGKRGRENRRYTANNRVHT